MKHWIIIGFFILSPISSLAQSPAIEALYDRYGAAEGITSVMLERKMMQMMSAQAERRNDGELARLLDEIGFIRVLTTTDDTDLAAEAEKAVKAGKHFELLTSTTAEGRTVRVYLRDSTLNEDKELVVITHGEDETAVVHIFGSFDLREVSRITSIRPR